MEAVQGLVEAKADTNKKNKAWCISNLCVHVDVQSVLSQEGKTALDMAEGRKALETPLASAFRRRVEVRLLKP